MYQQFWFTFIGFTQFEARDDELGNELNSNFIKKEEGETIEVSYIFNRPTKPKHRKRVLKN